MRGEIGLLSRNILFDSEDADGSDTYGGNLKVLSVLDVVDCLLHDDESYCHNMYFMQNVIYESEIQTLMGNKSSNINNTYNES